MNPTHVPLRPITTLGALLTALCIQAGGTHRTYYVAPDGSDTNAGTIDAPLATFGAAYRKATLPGDTVYFRGGTYAILPTEIMTPGSGVGSYSYVFDLRNAGSAAQGHIVYAGYPGERPVFDFSLVLPQSRISGFYLHADYIHLKNFDIVGIKATMHGHYQCECVSARMGSHCIVEDLAMHDNMAIGYYQTRGSYNLVVNCDAYCNYDNYSAFRDTDGHTADENYQYYIETGTVRSGSLSETLGGNCDGFGFHAGGTQYVGNVMRGCRAWWNSDDGFDCINSKAPVTWDSCWACYNGYEPGTSKSRGDGNGFKAGGYGMSVPCSGYASDTNGKPIVPRNIISHCVAYYNKAGGFYSNHHLGGNDWLNNTAFYNASNYNLTNRQLATIATAAVDVPGYGHVLRNNVSYRPKSADRHWYNLDEEACTMENNATLTTAEQFVSTSMSAGMAKSELIAPRQADGSLPVISFLCAKADSQLAANGQGALIERTEDLPPAAIESLADDQSSAATGCQKSVYCLSGQPCKDFSAPGLYVIDHLVVAIK